MVSHFVLHFSLPFLILYFQDFGIIKNRIKAKKEFLFEECHCFSRVIFRNEKFFKVFCKRNLFFFQSLIYLFHSVACLLLEEFKIGKIKTPRYDQCHSFSPFFFLPFLFVSRVPG